MINILSTTLLDNIKLLPVPGNISLDEVDLIDTKTTISHEQEILVNHLKSEIIVAIFTSMNAVSALGTINAGIGAKWKIYCLGQKTISLVNEYFSESTIVATAHNAQELAEKIVADNLKLPVHFFCGNIRRKELPDLLNDAGINLNEHVIYETIKNNVQINKQYDAILFYSPSAVEAFFKNNTILKQTTCFAIGKTTAATLQTFTTNDIIIGDVTGKKELLDLALSHYTRG